MNFDWNGIKIWCRDDFRKQDMQSMPHGLLLKITMEGSKTGFAFRPRTGIIIGHRVLRAFVHWTFRPGRKEVFQRLLIVSCFIF